MIVEELHSGHLDEWGVCIDDVPVLGFALRDQDRKLSAMGLVTWVERPVDPSYPPGWWVWFDSVGTVSPLAHKYAVKIRNELRSAGAECVFAFLDGSRPRAEAWMRRLGFTPYAEDVWRVCLGMGSVRRRAGGVRLCGEPGCEAGAHSR